MRILVIFTGGTIGSSVKKGWANVDDSTKYTLLDNFEYDKDEIEFVTSSPFSVLSENLSAVELNLLQEEISKSLLGKLDGIIVTHGTDTLQFTASAIEYAFGGCETPIVFVSADYPLEDERSNGNSNFEAAVEFIKSKLGKGVFVSYKNDDKSVTDIHIASRLLQHRESDSNLYSIGGLPYATYGEKIVNNNVVLSEQAGGMGIVHYVDDPCILSIETCPGNNYSYCLDDVNAVILKPYHSATLNTANKAFEVFCKRAQEKGIPVFVTNSSPGVFYESTKLFEKLNIKSLPYGTYVSAYMKIWAAISLGRNIEEFVQNPIANEIIL